MKELPKSYESAKYEESIYQLWEKSGFFRPEGLPDAAGQGEPYAIMMPPPNVTGVLHLGHALENSLMDTMARYQRMRGKHVLLLPGTDHAAVATQAKVEKLLQAEGVKHPREQLGREKLLERIRAYSEESKAIILQQIKKMGTSCDWSRLAYTFDEQRNQAVNEIFSRMYQDGLIYRGARVVNWSVKGQSTCSDDELVYVERPAKLYYFKYSHDFPITIASTRPETKLGDTAVAVNPTDERYRHLIGKIFTVDVGAAEPLSLKIIGSSAVDPAFGTGALGVTPAHSQVDFDVYEQQKAANDPIGLVQVIGQDGNMTAAAGGYAGLTVVAAREKFVAWLTDQGLLEKTEDISQNVGTHERFGDVAEALPLTQWFVAVNKEIPGRGKTLKELMRQAVESGHNGDPAQKVRITPERFEKIYYHWIEHLRDWCISRQIWWGHRIPVWYRGEESYVGAEAPLGEGWAQDHDTLDTWFSSGLWTFSTLGWPAKTADLKNFHPTSWMQMGHEILFFWMARMILMSTYALDQIPFKDVYIHGILRDELGKKFSKSSGNGVDPIEVIKQYGCDALRWSVLSGISPGNDSRFYDEKIEGARNLVNKLWNICRFMLLSISNPDSKLRKGILPATNEASGLADAWIVHRLERVRRDVTENLERFNFSYAGERLRDFTWNELADWYLEIAKIEGGKDELLNYIFNTLLKLWHPFMPFVTEAIWQEVYGQENLLMVEQWPAMDPLIDEFGEAHYFEHLEPTMAEADFASFQEIVTAIRSARADNKVEPAKKIAVYVKEKTPLCKNNAAILKALARISDLTVAQDTQKPEGAIALTAGGVEIFIDLAGAIDPEKEKARLEKELAEVAAYIPALAAKLQNQDFVARAPEKVIAGEKAKLAAAEEKQAKLKQQLIALSA